MGGAAPAAKGGKGGKGKAPPPPPPPASSSSGGGGGGGDRGDLLSQIQKGGALKKGGGGAAKPAPVVDVRSALMDAIANGASGLRKVNRDTKTAPEAAAAAGTDVANILANALLARRSAMDESDEDSDRSR